MMQNFWARVTLGLLWAARDDRYSELRGSGQAQAAERRVEMHYIGG